MREILFRGKRIDNGEWIEGYLLLCDERVFILPWGVVGCWHFDWLKKGEYIFGKFIEVIPETIGQYTGLTDKNGKRIFEGDIVISTNKRKLSKKPELVEYCPISGYWMCAEDREPLILGNIFDNP